MKSSKIWVLLWFMSCGMPSRQIYYDKSYPLISSHGHFFSSVIIDESGIDSESEGDLWPSTWSDDGHLYAANGDGKGFGEVFGDITFNRIYGHPGEGNIKGETISVGFGPIWGNTSNYNRKPTGLTSVDGILYLAVQDLNKTKTEDIFNEAPNATILKSEDKGKSWQWDKEKPMFSNHSFTTIMFLDYGRDGENNPSDSYLYAYGLDYNWRDSFSDIVKDPENLFLARVPKKNVQDPDKWEYYNGDLNGNADWSKPGAIEERKPVLTETGRRYKNLPNKYKGIENMSVLSQGSIVYNKPLDRYIYSSWTEYTYEFYEAPYPWGPWNLFLSKDFGTYPWSDKRFGGYATVIPSKYISDDGLTMWICSSTFAGGTDHYNFNLRKLKVNIND